ncbi:HNH endonuclease [Leptothoe sp. PORK10 BA2]
MTAAYRQWSIGEDIHIHHTVPHSQGGSNHSSNSVAVHLVCYSQLHR